MYAFCDHNLQLTQHANLQSPPDPMDWWPPWRLAMGMGPFLEVTLRVLCCMRMDGCAWMDGWHLDTHTRCATTKEDGECYEF